MKKTISRHKEKWSAFMNKHGLRNTKTRVEMLSFFEAEKRPVSAMEILAHLQKHSHSVHKTTVYREIETLIQKGILRPVELVAEYLHYEIASLKHHHHFVCTLCQKVTSVTLSETAIASAERKLEEEGHNVTKHRVDFFGICRQCRYI